MELRRTVTASRFVAKVVSAVPVEEPTAEEVPFIPDIPNDVMYTQETDLDMEEEEEAFNLEENIAHPTSYNWEDKYRPRKPKYFNRVHTGYEWNKYNQTHYEYVRFEFVLSFLTRDFLAPTIRRQKLYKDINSTYFTLTLSIRQKRLHTK